MIEQGFTLVELLIVIVILGILAGIVVFAVGNLTSSAKTSACSAEKSTISTAARGLQGRRPAPTRRRSADLDGVGQTPPASVGVLLKTAPPDYTIDSSGNVIVLTGRARTRTAAVSDVDRLGGLRAGGSASGPAHRSRVGTSAVRRSREVCSRRRNGL